MTTNVGDAGTFVALASDLGCYLSVVPSCGRRLSEADR